MANFYNDFEPEDAIQLEQLSRLIYELRENRDAILKSYGVADEIALLEQIYTSAVPEHPAYEHYLSARILSDTRETVRAMLAECLKEIGRK
ncbi:hypothetical protein [Aromatoleum aromaticum]|uniref:Uncharacterized protein n=1 Tax=Aromatoleum aromaticum (strain DSM 19018 / LMG 30748 / EbN1) TaxID=76114 RepID=Q5NZ08_AROAE|nr:hypothetical protein [Aromatoleum aromaticum]NMG55630.1 hypothetical protein [Aromatoleum aromaticum]CAI09706.1 hypothetical protein ebD113 [Aromatoleum aromaticum EbN1]